MPDPMPDPVVLFDIDGTLTDTNYLHTLAWRRAFLAHGHDVASSRIHRLIGASSTRLMEECIDRADDVVQESWRDRFDELIPEIRAFPGARCVPRRPRPGRRHAGPGAGGGRHGLGRRGGAGRAVSTVAERTGGWGHEELVQAGAIEVHAGTWALVEQLDATAIGDLLRR